MPAHFEPTRTLIALAIFVVFMASVPVVIGWAVTAIGEMFYGVIINAVGKWSA